MELRPSDLPSITAANFTKSLSLAGGRGMYIGFSAKSCSWCTPHEEAWAHYLGNFSNTSLPLLARVDGDRDESLLRKHEIDELPALVLAWSDRYTNYAGIHTRAALAAFGAAQLTPPAVELDGSETLFAIIEDQKRLLLENHLSNQPNAPAPLMLLGFFNDPDDEDAEDVIDFTHAAAELRQKRPDVAVRGVYIRMTPDLKEAFVRKRRWLERAPSAVLLVGGVPAHGPVGSSRGGAYRLDEADESGRTLFEWAAQQALPELGDLTPLTFAAYAATNLPMLIAFLDPADDITHESPIHNVTDMEIRLVRRKGLEKNLKAVGKRYHGKLSVVKCDGVAQKTRMLTVGLDPDGPLPQFAFNTKDGRQLPFPKGRKPTEKALAMFAADFLGERLPPKPKKEKKSSKAPSSSPPSPRKAMSSGGGSSSDGAGAAGTRVIDLLPSTFERIALDVTKDVLLLLHSKTGCDACDQMVIYYDKVATRVEELRLTHSLLVTRFDVKEHVNDLPTHLRTGIQLHELPIILMLPAKKKEPPFKLYDGQVKPKELLYFAKQYSSIPFELPPNPHLTREQHEAWKVQVKELPKEKVDAAYERLQKETGLSKDEL